MTLRMKATPLTEYERGRIDEREHIVALIPDAMLEFGRIDERERIVALIRDAMLEWGHNGAKGCVSCTTARMLSNVIAGRNPYD